MTWVHNFNQRLQNTSIQLHYTDIGLARFLQLKYKELPGLVSQDHLPNITWWMVILVSSPWNPRMKRISIGNMSRVTTNLTLVKLSMKNHIGWLDELQIFILKGYVGMSQKEWTLNSCHPVLGFPTKDSLFKRLGFVSRSGTIRWSCHLRIHQVGWSYLKTHQVIITVP